MKIRAVFVAMTLVMAFAGVACIYSQLHRPRRSVDESVRRNRPEAPGAAIFIPLDETLSEPHPTDVHLSKQQASPKTLLGGTGYGLPPEGVMLANPAKAAAFAETLESGEPRDRVMDRIARAWAIGNTEAALDWARQRKNPDESERLTGIIRSEKKKRDAFDAPETWVVDDLNVAINQFAWDPAKASAVENLAQKWAVQNPPAALNWVEQQPEGDMRDRLVVRIAITQAETSPTEAACLVIDQLSPGPVQTEAIISIVHKWGVLDPKGADAWLSSFPDGELKTRAHQELDGILKF